MKKVLVISRGIFHPTVFCRRQLRTALLESNGVNFHFTSNLSRLDGIDTNMYQSVVLFFHDREISESCLNSLLSFVKSGGGLFCIHGALASFKEYDTYQNLTGSSFTGHDRIREFKISGELQFSIKDELYLFDLKPDCEVRLRSGKVPVFWTKDYGNGRVACLSPGHKAQTLKNAIFRKLIKSIVTDEINLQGGEDG